MPAGDWGRAPSASVGTRIVTLALLVLAPLFVFFFYAAAVHFDLRDIFPPWRATAFGLYAIWIAFQLFLALLPDFLHKVVPFYRGGKILGPITPAGNEPTYQINGMQAWILTHLLFFLGAYAFGWWSPTLIADHWGPLLWATNSLGFAVALFAYLKARTFPTYPKDRKFSGSILYDFYMGIELHPRVRNFDLKLFINGRVGIVAWTLINWSFAAKQYALHGTVTNSMLLVNILQALYVIGFFWNESWYLKTIDIAHDHFGWMFAWGSCTWLPYMYTLQGLYLIYNPVHLSPPYALFVLILGLFAYALLRWANAQKDLFRRTGGDCKIWGKQAQKIDATYTSADGKTHKSNLLISGWWRIARHINYTGDLLGAAAYGLACGFGSFIPYFYLVFMTILLVHRCLRDERRCAGKYGPAWETYCQRVRYRLIPGIF
jgi:7-dehydrocholesterol reductase